MPNSPKCAKNPGASGSCGALITRWTAASRTGVSRAGVSRAWARREAASSASALVGSAATSLARIVLITLSWLTGPSAE